uniref:Arf-GAP domain-containing protein n=1 Tax=Clastoptera arizonana TaxID=38151 RepID=A0A1B6D4X7_9HEMI
MCTKLEKERTKQIQDKCQTLLTQMLRDEDNKYCVDCDAKGPRWASWNLGIFLCIRCAGIHRNLGVHISKVKSVNLDTWTPEQVISLQQMGNSRARAVYEANLPDNFRRPQTDSALEAFVRAKYESKKYIAREWVPPTLPKVNWDKELEEEADKARKKKKESKMFTPPQIAGRKALDTVIPQPLPKPSTSPKPQRNSQPTTSQQPPQQTQPSSDLLGLDTPVTENNPPVGSPTSDDMFSNFLSAPAATPSQAARRTPEEESFFNQPSNSPAAAGNKLTTDSILALYGKSQPTQPVINSTYQVPIQGGFIPQVGGVAYPPSSFPVTNGMVIPGTIQGTPYPGMVGTGQAAINAASNPFYNMAPTNLPLQTQQINYSAVNQLSQQMVGLNMGAPMMGQQGFTTVAPNGYQQPTNPVPMGQTLSNNLWQ